MKTLQKFTVYFIALLIFISVSSKAQKNFTYRDFKPQWEINLNGGLTQFYGDLWNGKILPSQNEVNTWRYGKGLIIGRQISPVLGIRAQAFMGEIDGEKKELSAHFISDVYEFNLHSTINLSNLFDQDKVNRTLNFYAVLGFGLVNYKTSKYLYDTDILFGQSGVGEGKGIDGMVMDKAIIGGLGLNVKITDHWGVNLESGNRLLLSDKIDITDDGKNWDMYNYTSIGLQYRFGKSSKKRFKTKTEPIVQKQVVEEPKEEVAVEKAIETPTTNIITKKDEPIKTDIQEVKDEEVTKQPVQQVKTKAQPKIEAEAKTKSVPLNGVEYRVQIRACHNCEVLSEHLAELYGLDAGMIKVDKYGSFNIYTIGSYPNYQKANDAKTVLKQKNGIKDAFIVAFENGKRLRKLPKL